MDAVSSEVLRPLEDEDELRIARPEAPGRLRVVAIGGGTGLPVILSGLTRFADGRGALPALDITAVVAVSDDGGSSGRLRREMGVPPPGDLRNCLVALAGKRRRALARLFQHRFDRGRGLKGHSVGNLLLSALSDLEGRDFLAALERASRMLHCRGKVLPCTIAPVQLVGTLADGRTLSGEQALVRARSRIRRVELAPRGAQAAPGVLAAIRDADVVVLGPGSLYTSVIANLLVGGVAEALRSTSALRVLVQNLMTEPGETDGLSAAEHLAAVLAHAGPVVDVMLVDRQGGLAHPAARRYAARAQAPVQFDRRAVVAQGVFPVEADLLADGKRIRHDAERAAAAVLGLSVHALEA